MIDSFQFKENYDINDLVDIVEILRSPEGCPWDREQDHKSIRRDFLEETYEVIEAINKDDRDGLLEELGDVLLQVVFHTQIEREKGSFELSNVADGICKKMIERHPHVFGNVNAETSEQVLENWDVIKKRTKSQKTQTERGTYALDGTTITLTPSSSDINKDTTITGTVTGDNTFTLTRHVSSFASSAVEIQFTVGASTLSALRSAFCIQSRVSLGFCRRRSVACQSATPNRVARHVDWCRLRIGCSLPASVYCFSYPTPPPRAAAARERRVIFSKGGSTQ